MPKTKNTKNKKGILEKENIFEYAQKMGSCNKNIVPEENKNINVEKEIKTY